MQSTRRCLQTWLVSSVRYDTISSWLGIVALTVASESNRVSLIWKDVYILNFNFEQPIDVLHLRTMARPSTVAPRNLTLTEELEKLEQSITLTLQGKFAHIRIAAQMLTKM